jgi:hypothetical protein
MNGFDRMRELDRRLSRKISDSLDELDAPARRPWGLLDYVWVYGQLVFVILFMLAGLIVPWVLKWPQNPNAALALECGFCRNPHFSSN